MKTPGKQPIQRFTAWQPCMRCNQWDRTGCAANWPGWPTIGYEKCTYQWRSREPGTGDGEGDE